ncbi:hypothetical protein H0H93_006973 [Arthromyces matolae]|nr:hypothetical protein H0H93_006973 [Arthromyces matolae]
MRSSSRLKRQELREILERQRTRLPEKLWPNSKTTIPELIDILLNPAYGFTTDELATRSNERQAGVILNPSLDASNTASALPHLQALHKRTLYLYIADDRIASKSTVAFEATVADRIGCAPGEWRVMASHVLEELQKSSSPIHGQGPIRIGVPDPINSDFTAYFVESSVRKLATARTSPTHLIVSASNRSTLTLRVECIPRSAAVHKLMYDEFPSDDDTTSVSQFPPDFRPLNAARERCGLPSPKRSQSNSNATAAQYLNNIVKSRPGYIAFVNSRHAVLQNPDIPAVWKFVAAFKNDFYEKEFGEITGESNKSGKRVTKKMIRIALAMGETSFREAEEGDRLLGVYGSGGEHEAAEVVNEVNAERDVPLGKGALLRFLQEWERNHTV